MEHWVGCFLKFFVRPGEDEGESDVYEQRLSIARKLRPFIGQEEEKYQYDNIGFDMDKDLCKGHIKVEGNTKQVVKLPEGVPTQVIQQQQWQQAEAAYEEKLQELVHQVERLTPISWDLFEELEHGPLAPQVLHPNHQNEQPGDVVDSMTDE